MDYSKEALTAKIAKTKEILKENLNTVRAGRANPALLDKVMVEYYGSPTPLKALANVSTPDPRTIMVVPFDPKTVKDIEKAIEVANLGLNPGNDGKTIRLVIPTLTEERRKELTKTTKKMGEEAKVAVRNLRRDMNEAVKKDEKNGDISEDDRKEMLEEIQKTVDKGVKEIDEMIKKKDAEIMEV